MTHQPAARGRGWYPRPMADSPVAEDPPVAEDLPVAEEMGITWENRVLRRLPRSPLLVAVIITAVISSLYVAGQLALGYAIDLEPLVLALFIGYSAAVNVYLTASIDRDGGWLDEIPDLERGPFFLMHPVAVVARSRFAGAVGFAMGLVVIETLVYASGGSLGAAWTELNSNTLVIPILLLLSWLIGRFAYFSLAYSDTWTRLDGGPIDLLDLSPLYARGRIGLRVALVWIVGVSIAGLFFIDDTWWAVGPGVALCLLVGTAALVIPVRGVARQVRALKRHELERVRLELRQVRDEVMDRGEHGGRLADLLAYEAKIESISEWPFDVPTLRRFGLYLLIPLGSMVGGAVVERIVDALLDR